MDITPATWWNKYWNDEFNNYFLERLQEINIEFHPTFCPFTWLPGHHKDDLQSIIQINIYFLASRNLAPFGVVQNIIQINIYF